MRTSKKFRYSITPKPPKPLIHWPDGRDDHPLSRHV